jgi:hypothetical protein
MNLFASGHARFGRVLVEARSAFLQSVNRGVAAKAASEVLKKNKYLL